MSIRRYETAVLNSVTQTIVEGQAVRTSSPLFTFGCWIDDSDTNVQFDEKYRRYRDNFRITANYSSALEASSDEQNFSVTFRGRTYRLINTNTDTTRRYIHLWLYYEGQGTQV